jgi:serine/threonine protein kinase
MSSIILVRATAPLNSQAAEARCKGHQFEKENLFIFMEYVSGASLSDILNVVQAFAETEARPIIRQIALGLIYIHSFGLVHESICPSNIMVDETGCVKICGLENARGTLT